MSILLIAILIIISSTNLIDSLDYDLDEIIEGNLDEDISIYGNSEIDEDFDTLSNEDVEITSMEEFDEAVDQGNLNEKTSVKDGEVCVGNECKSEGLWKRLIGWIKNIFKGRTGNVVLTENKVNNIVYKLNAVNWDYTRRYVPSLSEWYDERVKAPNTGGQWCSYNGKQCYDYLDSTKSSSLSVETVSGRAPSYTTVYGYRLNKNTKIKITIKDIETNVIVAEKEFDMTETELASHHRNSDGSEIIALDPQFERAFRWETKTPIQKWFGDLDLIPYKKYEINASMSDYFTELLEAEKVTFSFVSNVFTHKGDYIKDLMLKSKYLRKIPEIKSTILGPIYSYHSQAGADKQKINENYEIIRPYRGYLNPSMNAGEGIFKFSVNPPKLQNYYPGEETSLEELSKNIYGGDRLNLDSDKMYAFKYEKNVGGGYLDVRCNPMKTISYDELRETLSDGSFKIIPARGRLSIACTWQNSESKYTLEINQFLMNKDKNYMENQIPDIVVQDYKDNYVKPVLNKYLNWYPPTILPQIEDGTTPPQDNPVSYWRFDGNLDDEIGGVSSNIVGNAEYTSDAISGQAIQVGESGHIEIQETQATDISQTNAYTISGWFKLNTGDATGNSFFWSDYTWNKSGYLSIVFSRDQKFYYYNTHKDSQGNQFKIMKINMFTEDFTDKWHHLVQQAYIVNGKTIIKIYLDGALRGSSEFENTEGFVNEPNNLKLAVDLDGIVDEVKIWNYALSENEINQEFER